MQSISLGYPPRVFPRPILLAKVRQFSATDDFIRNALFSTHLHQSWVIDPHPHPGYSPPRSYPASSTAPNAGGVVRGHLRLQERQFLASILRNPQGGTAPNGAFG